MSIVSERINPQTLTWTKNGYVRDRHFLVEDCNSIEDSITADGIPSPDTPHPTLAGAVVSSVESEMLEEDDSRYLVKVKYQTEEETTTTTNNTSVSAQALSSFSFDTGAESKRVLVARTPTPDSASFAPAGKDKIPSGSLIGFDGEKVQGVDIPIPAFKFSVSRKYTAEEIDNDYLRDLSRVGYHVADSSYAGWAKGELLFEGGRGRYAPGGPPTIVGDEGCFSNLEGITGGTSGNTYNGNLYGVLERIPGLANFRVFLYANPGRTKLAASNTMASLGDIILSPEGGSGLGGKITLLKYTRDLDDIVITLPFPWEISYSFAVSPNESSLTIGDITATNKLGWQVADVFYQDAVENVGGKNRNLQKARMVYFHEVFPEADLTFLRIAQSDILP